MLAEERPQDALIPSPWPPQPTPDAEPRWDWWRLREATRLQREATQLLTRAHHLRERLRFCKHALVAVLAGKGTVLLLPQALGYLRVNLPDALGTLLSGASLLCGLLLLGCLPLYALGRFLVKRLLGKSQWALARAAQLRVEHAAYHGGILQSPPEGANLDPRG